MTPPVTGVILAAGLSRRMGQDKLLLCWQGKPLLQHTIDLVRGLGLHRRILVTTPERLCRVDAAGLEVVENPHPQQGQSASVRLGTQAAPPGDCLLFFPADQPLLDTAAVEPLLAACDGTSILYPLHADGSPASPTLFPPGLRPELLALTGDRGGRTVRRAHPALCRGIAVPSPALLADIDTEADYRRLLAEEL